jgi:signal transduction histidine kinase/DNA-binding response OmpR family regulator
MKSALQLQHVLASSELLNSGFCKTIIFDLQNRLLWPDELAQQNLNDLLIGPEQLREKLEVAQVFHFPTLKLAWQGKSIQTPLRGQPLFEDQQHCAWLFSFDPSDSRLEIQNLKNRIEDLEKNSIAKSEFLANMSHELRSPLTSIIGMSHMLMETELDPEQKECAEVITTSSSGLLNLINDTLDISKLDAGKVHLEKIPFNLYGLVEQVCRSFLLQTQQKGLFLTIDYHPDLCQQMLGDPGRLRQILNNLISNAIKFTSEGGITITLRGNQAEPNKISIWVNDTGIGIPEKSCEKIFNKFEQADQSTTRRYGGTGLGLAICKELCELMEGTIKLDSIVGQSSTFKIELQLEPIQNDDEHKLTRVEIENKKVLCVDSNPALLKIMARNLRKSGLECLTAETGTMAMKLLLNALENLTPYDVVITDFQLADIDGLELAQQIKKNNVLKSTHLVMLTSLGKKGDSQRVSEAGFEAYLVKPTAHEILLDTLACVCSNRQNKNHELITKYTLSEERASANPVQGPTHITLQTSSTSSNNSAIEPQTLPILIAEDDPMIQKVLHKLMKKWNYDYTLVENGKLAVEHYQKEKPKLILMDWHMPECDGLTATKKIREIEGEQRATWIIGLTAGGADNVKEKCLAAGMDDHLQKPFDLDVFKTVLQQGLEMAKSLQNP